MVNKYYALDFQDKAKNGGHCKLEKPPGWSPDILGKSEGLKKQM